MDVRQQGEQITSAGHLTGLIEDTTGVLSDARRNYRGPGEGKVRDLFARYMAALKEAWFELPKEPAARKPRWPRSRSP